MEKKDLLFLATTLVYAQRTTNNVAPYPKDEAGKQVFNKWYEFLAARYEELPSPGQTASS
jgi:hypothetical protein